MRLFDAYIVIDWSATSGRAPVRPSPDAVWVGERLIKDSGYYTGSSEIYFRTRTSCIEHIRNRLLRHTSLGKSVFIGFDFGYGYPAGFAEAVGIVGTDPPWRRVWSELANLIKDYPDGTNNRFEVADKLNSLCTGATLGPFWGCPAGSIFPHLDSNGATFPYQNTSGLMLNRLRETERPPLGVQEVWKLWGNGNVGSQTLVGIPAVAQLRDDPELQHISQVWPFETGFGLNRAPPGTPFILHAEIWPGVVNGLHDPFALIKDQAQVRAMVSWLANLDASSRLLPLFERPAVLSDEAAATCITEEGWILGVGAPIPPSFL